MGHSRRNAQAGRQGAPGRGRRARPRGAWDAGDEIRLVLASRMEYLDAVHRLAEEIGRAAGLSRPQAFELGMAVREAFVNALTHGNRLDRSKKVRLSFRVGNEGVRACVADEGAGFTLDQTPDPLAPENLNRPEGRGVFLMRNYVDELEVRRGPAGGSRICLFKRLASRGRRLDATGRRRP